MWAPLQVLAGVLVVVAGFLAIRGLRRRPPRAGVGFLLLRILRRLAGVLVLLVGLGVLLDGTPFMTAHICVGPDEGPEWCFGSGSPVAAETGADGGDPALLDSPPEEGSAVEE